MLVSAGEGMPPGRASAEKASKGKPDPTYRARGQRALSPPTQLSSRHKLVAINQIQPEETFSKSA